MSLVPDYVVERRDVYVRDPDDGKAKKLTMDLVRLAARNGAPDAILKRLLRRLFWGIVGTGEFEVSEEVLDAVEHTAILDIVLYPMVPVYHRVDAHWLSSTTFTTPNPRTAEALREKIRQEKELAAWDLFITERPDVRIATLPYPGTTAHERDYPGFNVTIENAASAVVFGEALEEKAPCECAGVDAMTIRSNVLLSRIICKDVTFPLLATLQLDLRDDDRVTDEDIVMWYDPKLFPGDEAEWESDSEAGPGVEQVRAMLQSRSLAAIRTLAYLNEACPRLAAVHLHLLGSIDTIDTFADVFLANAALMTRLRNLTLSAFGPSDGSLCIPAFVGALMRHSTQRPLRLETLDIELVNDSSAALWKSLFDTLFRDDVAPSLRYLRVAMYIGNKGDSTAYQRDHWERHKRSSGLGDRLGTDAGEIPDDLFVSLCCEHVVRRLSYLSIKADHIFTANPSILFRFLDTLFDISNAIRPSDDDEGHTLTVVIETFDREFYREYMDTFDRYSAEYALGDFKLEASLRLKY
jgi:hypothetical protein